MRPEISIIVTVYNAEMSVARLIDSILSQRTPSKLSMSPTLQSR